MKKPKRKSLLTDSEVRKIYDSRLPEFRPDQKIANEIRIEMYKNYGGDIDLFPCSYTNVYARTIEAKRAIVYKMKSKYLNHKTV